jgi:hypothetical protein
MRKPTVVPQKCAACARVRRGSSEEWLIKNLDNRRVRECTRGYLEIALLVPETGEALSKVHDDESGLAKSTFSATRGVIVGDAVPCSGVGSDLGYTTCARWHEQEVHHTARLDGDDD